jgi:asparagine synthase (glutamine-hydrolysing)
MKVEIQIENCRKYQFENGELWFVGFLHNWNEFFTTIKNISIDINNNSNHIIQSLIEKMDGQFSFVYKCNMFTISVCDRIRSHPLFYISKNEILYISDRALKLKNSLGLTVINEKAVLCLRMSGYTYKNYTIYENLYQLPAGHLLNADHVKNKSNIFQYYNYSPWKAKTISVERPKKELTHLTLKVLKKLIDSINGRPICISISAGLDSRCIVSGLSKLGYKDVKCFSYGLKNNFEAVAGEKIAEKLNYPYYFVNKTPTIMKEMFQSADYRKYLQTADTCAATTNVHQFYAVKKLKEAGFASKDDVFVNGYSGDFLAGDHIPKNLRDTHFFDFATRKENMLNYIITKHYSLWEDLKNPKNVSLIKEIILEEFGELFSAESSGELDYAFYENYEWKNRQTLFAMNQPRIYEFWGYDWRFPLWDYEFIDFWEKVPLELKLNRNLFYETFFENNWGSVWQDFDCPIYKSPRYLALIKNVIHFIMFPWGQKKFEKINKKYFFYWMENLSYMGIVDYKRVIKDKRGYRHAISWLTDSYLEEKGIL